MKRFFYLSAALLCLSLAFHFGYTTARAQAPGNPIVGIAATSNVAGNFLAVTPNGDVYQTENFGGTWTLRANVFAGAGPTGLKGESWGQLKSRYAPSGGTVSKGADTR